MKWKTISSCELKATDHLKLRADKQAVICRVEGADLLGRLGETYPVILVVYDAQADIGYWLYVQAHFAGQTRRIRTKEFQQCQLPVVNVVNEDAILVVCPGESRYPGSNERSQAS